MNKADKLAEEIQHIYSSTIGDGAAIKAKKKIRQFTREIREDQKRATADFVDTLSIYEKADREYLKQRIIEGK